MSSTPSITESPWYWVHLFSAAGLVALVLLTPKFGPRQAQIEQNYQARQRAARAAAGQEPDTPLSTDARTLISLSPLYVGLAAVFFVSGVKIWRRRTTARFHSSQEVTTS
ncbi:MAG: hypothetical protein QGG36_28205 [Pirellulaceae bacterium]|nr:hypothetical protein [Pirellulaceae bacterium]